MVIGEIDFRRWVEQGDWSQIRDWLSARSQDSLTPDEWLAGGLLYAYGETPRDLAKAIRWLEKANERRPDHADTLVSLAHLYAQSGRLVLAFSTAKEATRVDAGNPKAWVALGLAAHHCKEVALGNEAIDRAWSLADGLHEGARQVLLRSTRHFAPFWRTPLMGRSLRLERLDLSHLDFVVHCRNSTEFRRQYHMFQSQERASIQSDIERSAGSPLETRQIQWVIVRDDNPVGLAALVDLDFKHLRAEPLIGFPGLSPGAHAVEASLLMQEYAFCTLGLNRLYTYVYGINPKAQSYIRNLGFSLEGVMREHVQDPLTRTGVDLYLSSLLRDDFLSDPKNTRLANRLLGRQLVQWKRSMVALWSAEVID